MTAHLDKHFVPLPDHPNYPDSPFRPLCGSPRGWLVSDPQQVTCLECLEAIRVGPSPVAQLEVCHA